jgi:hypothetical protein
MFKWRLLVEDGQRAMGVATVQAPAEAALSPGMESRD